jgi:hypothetical protein
MRTFKFPDNATQFHPLPGGEGWGEGERKTHIGFCPSAVHFLSGNFF